MGNRGLWMLVAAGTGVLVWDIWIERSYSPTTTNKTAPAETLRDPPQFLGLDDAPHAPPQEAGAVPLSPEASGTPDSSLGSKPGTGSSLTSGGASGVLSTANLHLAGPDYQPTRERFLDLGASLAGIEPEELWDLDETFWERWPQYETMRHTWTSGSLSEAVGVVVDPRAELERLWEKPGVEDLWVTHQVTAWRRANAMQGGLVKEVAEASRYMDSLRRLIWREGDEVYQWLYECDQELR